VVTVSHTAVATVAAIDLVGATPVLVDVDPKTYTLGPGCLEAALTGPEAARIRAVIPVHLYGHPADMGAIFELAGRRDLFVIEDCAQAHGARLDGRRVGTFGHFGAFSFYPTKNLGCLGDGGALVTNDAGLAERAQLLKQYGWRERYVSSLPGMNTRLDELQAAILRAKLPHLDRLNTRRREIASLYRHLLDETPLSLPGEAPGAEHVYHQFVVRARNRDGLRAHLERQGIGTAVLYPVPVHPQPGYRDRVSVPAAGLPHTERLCEQILSLPLYPEMTDADARRAACTTAAWLEAEES
jgi:dTDP-4-amino-4,6-dideoxygalactose transaminase